MLANSNIAKILGKTANFPIEAGPFDGLIGHLRNPCVTDFRSQWFPDTQVGFSPPSCPGSNVVGDVEGRPDRRSAPGVAPLVSRSDRTATDSRSRLCSRWSSPVVVCEPTTHR